MGVSLGERASGSRPGNGARWLAHRTYVLSYFTACCNMILLSNEGMSLPRIAKRVRPGRDTVSRHIAKNNVSRDRWYCHLPPLLATRHPPLVTRNHPYLIVKPHRAAFEDAKQRASPAVHRPLETRPDILD